MNELGEEKHKEYITCKINVREIFIQQHFYILQLFSAPLTVSSAHDLHKHVLNFEHGIQPLFYLSFSFARNYSNQNKISDAIFNQ